MCSANIGLSRRTFLDAAPNGANRGWGVGRYKDFAPTELRSESFVTRGRAPSLHAVFEAPIGGASHSVCGGIRRVRPGIWNRVGRVPQPRRPETGVTRWGVHVEESVTRPKGAAANRRFGRKERCEEQ